MSERKAINKWYPPDYDPSKVPKKEKSRSASADKVRLMLPFSMKCLQCSEYIAARRKFNARKEVTNEKYMGFKIIKFHVRCPRCNNNIIFRTDPALAGFAPVEGGVRNHESLAKEPKIKPAETEDEILARLEKEEEESKKYKEQQQRRKNNPFWQRRGNAPDQDAMTNLEERLAKQQEEQEVHDHLMYLQAKANRLQESGGLDKLALEAHTKVAEKLDKKRNLETEDEVLYKKAQTGKPEKEEIAKRIPTVLGVISVKRPTRGDKKETPTYGTPASTLPAVDNATYKIPESINGVPGISGYDSD